MKIQRGQKQEKHFNHTANFERLSGLIDESHSNERKAKLIAHYKRIKEARREEIANSDWRKATPVISTGSTFYKDLFDLRDQVRNQAQNPSEIDIKLGLLSSSMQDQSQLEQLD